MSNPYEGLVNSTSGPATEKAQSIGNGFLESLDSKIQNPMPITGTITATIDPEGLATDTNQVDGTGLKTDASATTDTGNFTLISLFKRLLEKITNIISVKITDGAGIVNSKQLGTQLTNADVGIVANTTIHGLSSQGGGTFHDVKVDPAGKLLVIADLLGTKDNGDTVPLNATPEGHLEIAIHDPLAPFGSLHAEKYTPVFQADAVYGISANQQAIFSVLSGSVNGNNNLFNVKTGTTQFGYGVLQSRKRLRYRSGQGSICRFTAMFTSPVANSIQVAGLGHGEDGFFIGYNGAQFGILYSRFGVRECRTYTVTTASTTNENVTVTLNGSVFTVPVTNSGSTLRTAYEIANYDYGTWRADAVGSTVQFLRGSSGVANGTYSIVGTTIAGTFAQTRAGVAAQETWVYQADFNGDTLDGNGLNFTIDPLKLNVYEIGMQYLGAGAVSFKCETYSATGDNNPQFNTFHTFKFPNTLTAPTVGNPSMPFMIASYSAGSTADLTVSSASYAGFVEGEKILHGNRFTYDETSTAVTAAAFKALYTIKNRSHYKNRANQSIINLVSIAGAIKHTNPVTIYIIKNGTLTGTPNFSAYDTDSCSLYDNSATNVTFTLNSQKLISIPLGDTGNFAEDFADELTLQPGEWITIAARSASGSPAYVTVSLNTREDQ